MKNIFKTLSIVLLIGLSANAQAGFWSKAWDTTKLLGAAGITLFACNEWNDMNNGKFTPTELGKWAIPAITILGGLYLTEKLRDAYKCAFKTEPKLVLLKMVVTKKDNLNHFTISEETFDKDGQFISALTQNANVENKNLFNYINALTKSCKIRHKDAYVYTINSLENKRIKYVEKTNNGLYIAYDNNGWPLTKLFNTEEKARQAIGLQ